MSKFYFWSIDNNGYVYSLSSWNSCWERVNCSNCTITKFKTLAASSWCVWAIGFDNELYIFIPNSDIVIKTPEVIIENQRKNSGIFSYKYLKPPDPPEFTTPNYYGKLLPTDLKSFKLPSNRWKWENDWKIRINFNGQLTNEGWVYSNNFTRKFQVERYFIYSNVRRRFWQRYRIFHAFDRWLYISQDTQPFEISCSQDCCNDLEMVKEGSDSDLSGILDVACGGEMLPHQEDGFLSVWIVNAYGQILFRLNVHRQNPEGSHWCHVKLPKCVRAASLAVGPLGSLIVCTSFGDIFFRENISWKNPMGTSWKLIQVPIEILDKEQIIQLSISIYSIWVRSNLNRIWLRSNVNLHESKSKLSFGDGWLFVSTDVICISSSASEQLFALTSDGNYISYKTSKSKNFFGKHFWSGKLPVLFNKSENMDCEKLTKISGSGLFMEDDILPINWVESPFRTRKIYNKHIDSSCDWKMNILQSLKIRDNLEYKNPKYSNYMSSFEQTFWSKASECKIQCLSADNNQDIWLPASVILHHKVKGNITHATLHVSARSVDLFNLDCILFFIESKEVICLSKCILESSRALYQDFQTCSTIIIFIKNKILSPISNQYTNVSRMLLKFQSETDVEDWIMAVSFVSLTEKHNFDKSYSSKAWFINTYYEPFMTVINPCDDTLNRWHLDGGHFSKVETGAKGCITWAIGFNGIAWAHSQGWGGSYLGPLCSSKDYLATVHDSRIIYIMEYQKLKYLPGQLSGKFIHYMWTDEFGKLIRDKESVLLSSKRWQWSNEWGVCITDKSVDDSWQYSVGVRQKFDNNLTWNKTIRRRKWCRTYQTSVVGPWKEIRNSSVKVIHLAIFPGIDYKEDQNHFILAITTKNTLLIRKGVTINRPEGLLWVPLKTDLKLVWVNINNNGIVWVVCTGGFIWRLRWTNFRDITQINMNGWEKLKHIEEDGRFIEVSSGDNSCLWAIDSDNKLWVRKFNTDIVTANIGLNWIFVSDGVRHVSCASLILVWVVFIDGCLAERTGITTLIPQGIDWNIKLNGISTYVSINSA